METLQQKNEIKSYNLRLEVRFLWGCLTTTEMVFDGIYVSSGYGEIRGGNNMITNTKDICDSYCITERNQCLRVRLRFCLWRVFETRLVFLLLPVPAPVPVPLIIDIA
jgi:hypothetical protein